MASSGFELLLELGEGGSRKEIFVSDPKDVLKKVAEEAEKHFQLENIEFSGLSTSTSKVAGAQFILQKWSSKWNEYVDISSSQDIQGNDKLKLLPKPTTVSHKNQK